MCPHPQNVPRVALTDTVVQLLVPRWLTDCPTHHTADLVHDGDTGGVTMGTLGEWTLHTLCSMILWL